MELHFIVSFIRQQRQISEQGRHLEGGAGGAFTPMNLKNNDFFSVFAYKIVFFIFCPPLRKSVKMLPPPLENLK